MSHQLTDLYAWQRPGHRKVLAWLMVAIFVGKDVCLERLGLNLPRVAMPERMGQQFRHWLKNDRLDARVIYDPVAQWLVSQMRGCRLRIQIDHVQLKKPSQHPDAQPALSAAGDPVGVAVFVAQRQQS